MRCVRGFGQDASRRAGLVGAGRSEVMCAIFGLDPITSGSVYLNGREVHIKNTRDAINHGIAMVSEDRRTYSSSFFCCLLICTIQTAYFRFSLLRFHYEISSLYAILRLAIKGRKEVFRMNEQEKTTMDIIEPEGLSSCGADSGTWCGQALTRVLIGMTLTGLTLNVLCLNYILPAIGMVFLLVGLRALRRENAGFKGGYVIAILRTFYITVWMILDTTIYADVLTGTTAAVVLTLFNLVIVLAQVVCLWSGLKALRQKAGFEAKCGAAAALIVWNIVLCALGVMNWSGWIVFGIIMIVLYIIIMRRLFALAGELDNAGCTITPVPVRVKDWQLVLSLAVLLAAGMVCGYAFGGSYPMEWTPLDNSAQAEVQSTKAKLLELGFPEAVLNDLSAEDIASCEGATQILSRTEDKPVTNGRGGRTLSGEKKWYANRHGVRCEGAAPDRRGGPREADRRHGKMDHLPSLPLDAADELLRHRGSSAVAERAE